jgi:Putative phage serine protease XkdF
MTIQKAQWNTDGDNVRLSMPFSKVDQERRIVSGFATLDNVDRQKDIVTPEASVKAFTAFRGNIREMHQPIAVGKMVAFKEDKYFDPETKKFYSGIYVSAYVSKGAQDCWEKVLDGTYTGFSIGGRMNDWEDGYDENIDAPIRIIKDYDLMELSLVDTPANQFANILSVEKIDGVQTLTGDAAETVIENVFWDKESGIVMLSENDVEVSPSSGIPMQNIGFVEKLDNEKTEMIKFLVDSAKGISTAGTNKEANTMTDELKSVVDDEIAPEAVAENEISPVEAEGAETAPSDEPATPEEDAAEDATEEIDDEVVTKADEATVDSVAAVKDAVTSAFSELTAIVKSLNDEIVELKKSLGEVANKADLANAKIADAEGDFSNLGKRIDAVEADTAFRKSGDLGEIVQEPAMVEKSVWGGRFLNSADLLK